MMSARHDGCVIILGQRMGEGKCFYWKVCFFLLEMGNMEKDLLA